MHTVDLGNYDMPMAHMLPISFEAYAEKSSLSRVWCVLGWPLMLAVTIRMIYNADYLRPNTIAVMITPTGNRRCYKGLRHASISRRPILE